MERVVVLQYHASRNEHVGKLRLVMMRDQTMRSNGTGKGVADWGGTFKIKKFFRASSEDGEGGRPSKRGRSRRKGRS